MTTRNATRGTEREHGECRRAEQTEKTEKPREEQEATQGQRTQKKRRAERNEKPERDREGVKTTEEAEKGWQTTQRGQRRHNNSRGTMIEWWEVELFCLSVETCLRCGVSQCRHRHATSTASGAWLPGTHARSCHWGLGLQVTKGRMSKLCRTQPSETARTRTNTTCAAR